MKSELDFSKTLDNPLALLCSCFFLVRFSVSCQFFDPLSQVPLVHEWGVRHSTITCSHFLVLTIVCIVVADHVLVGRLSSLTTSGSFRCFVFIWRIFSIRKNFEKWLFVGNLPKNENLLIICSPKINPSHWRLSSRWVKSKRWFRRESSLISYWGALSLFLAGFSLRCLRWSEF